MRRILLAYILSISATVVWVHAFAEEMPPATIAIEEPATEAAPAVSTEAPQTDKDAPSAEPPSTPEPAPAPAPAAEAPTATEVPAATPIAEEPVIPEAPALPEEVPVAAAVPASETEPATPVTPAPKGEPAPAAAPAPNPAEPKVEAPAPTPPETTPAAPEQAPTSNPPAEMPSVPATVETNVVQTIPSVPAICDANSIRIPDLTGEWCGSWNSCTNGHNGPMRATFCRLCNGDYQVTFCGRFCKVIPFRYTTVLKTTGYSDGVVYLSGSQSLGPIFGTFSYNAWANDRTFASGYRASKDQGEFHLSR